MGAWTGLIWLKIRKDGLDLVKEVMNIRVS